LPTNDPIASNWTSRVVGGKSHALVMSVAGLLSGHLRQADDRIGVDLDQASGRSDAAAFGEVWEHGAGLRLGEMGLGQRRALALGEAVLAGLAVEEADRFVPAVPPTNREVSGLALAGERAIGFLAAEAREIVHGVETPAGRERDRVRSWERDASERV
jgi:hypothetical protein